MPLLRSTHIAAPSPGLRWLMLFALLLQLLLTGPAQGHERAHGPDHDGAHVAGAAAHGEDGHGTALPADPDDQNAVAQLLHVLMHAGGCLGHCSLIGIDAVALVVPLREPSPEQHAPLLIPGPLLLPPLRPPSAV